jgi:hypothetical protein
MGSRGVAPTAPLDPSHKEGLPMAARSVQPCWISQLTRTNKCDFL